MSTVEVSAPEAAPPSPGRWRALLLAAVAACAACGIIYELALLTLSASLDGGGIVATSLIVAGYIAALGAGALLVKPLLPHAASRLADALPFPEETRTASQLPLEDDVGIVVVVALAFPGGVGRFDQP